MNKPIAPPQLAGEFAKIVGEKYALTDPDAIAPYLTEERNLYQGHSALVLCPGSTAEVSQILALATATRTPIVPQGGNTGLVGGQTPHHGEVVLSLKRLNRIREIDTDSNTITAEAGTVLATVQQAAREAGRLYPLSLAAEGSCTVGGTLSTNAGGTGALAYGVARELMVGVEVVLADGRVLNALRKLKKDNTGYDLRHIFVGAEGTLGVITAAVLKLFPLPKAVETAWIGVPSPQAALDLLARANAVLGGQVTTYELMSKISVDFTLRHAQGCRAPLAGEHAWHVLLEVSSQRPEGLREAVETVLAEGVEHGLVEDAAIAASLDQARAFWRIRDLMSEMQKPEGGSIKHDVSVPVAAVPAFIAEASDAATALIPGSRPVPFGHLGDGNIHFNVSQPIGADKEAFLARWHDMNEAVHAVVQKYHGSISAEHGIGVLKRDLLPEVKDPVSLALMRSLKALLDPHNILNPGKVL